tara:strand:+ start:52 stop:342 length:291 start_codon:yes stop_codon:yes gene_type:complete
MPTEMENYLFDLNGYLILKNVVSKEHIDELNAIVDTLLRIMVYRYGPKWGPNPYGYEPSPEMLQRLTPERRQIVQPIAPDLPLEEMAERGLFGVDN